MANPTCLIDVKRKFQGQYYTESTLGSLLVSHFDHGSVSIAVELGVGKGALLSAVVGRWPQAKLVSVDIDPQHRNAIGRHPANHSHFCLDALRPDLPSKIGVEPDSVDLAVCNPPFVAPNWRRSFPMIMKRAGLAVPDVALTMNADALFLAQNLWMLRRNGQLGIIVPAGIISGSKNRDLRDSLLSQHAISGVTELPVTAFRGTEVKTFILSLRKSCATNAPIWLSRCDSNGAIEPPIMITHDEASRRLDYGYYAWERGVTQLASEPNDLSKLTVLRGNIGTAEAVKNNWQILHTTDLSVERLRIPRRLVPSKSMDSPVIAKKGDVLLARVGRNLEEKVAIVESGTAAISDCLFALRSKYVSPQDLFDAVTSTKGKNWIRAHSRGACARFISKADLLRFPLI